MSHLLTEKIACPSISISFSTIMALSSMPTIAESLEHARLGTTLLSVNA